VDINTFVFRLSVKRRIANEEIQKKMIKFQGTSSNRGFYKYSYKKREPVSSVSIVSVYGLDGRAIGVRSPAGAKDISSSLCVQTGSGAHPASCTMGTGGPFPGGKARPGRDVDHSPHLVPRSLISRRDIFLSPQAPP
jgi:hypothetical protein